MKTKLVMAACLLLGACASVNSGLPTTAGVNGDIWYTKEHTLLKLLTTGADVFYCPKDTPGKCEKATWADAAK